MQKEKRGDGRAEKRADGGAVQSRSREHLGGRVCLRVDDKKSV